jgi:hypothetical protein
MSQAKLKQNFMEVWMRMNKIKMIQTNSFRKIYDIITFYHGEIGLEIQD